MKKKYSLNKIVGINTCHLKTIVLFLILGFSIPTNAQCNVPTNLRIESRTANGGTIAWDAPSPAPESGYHYYINTIATPPFFGNTTSNTSITFNSYSPGTTLYFYLASNCFNGDSAWIGPITLNTLSPNTGCPSAPYGINPAEVFNPTFTPTPDIIATDSYAGQYSRVNILRNRQYVFNSSVPTDYITITNESLGVLAHGPAPLTWNSATILPNNSVIRYFTTTNSSCGTAQIGRTKTIKGQLVPGCAPPTNVNASSIQNNSALLTWNFQTGGMHYYISTSSITPNINQTPTGFTNQGAIEVNGLSANTTYNYWLRRVCDNNTFSVSEWVSGGSFTTQASDYIGCPTLSPGQDLTTTFVPGCFGNQEIISTSFDAGEFNVVRIQKNKIYTFYSSVLTDFITIRSEDGYIIASGTTPLVWSSGDNAGDCKFYMNTSINCGIEFIDRTQSIKCTDASPSCDAPNAFSIISITGTTANVSWVGANHIPSNGYQYYVSTSNTTPNSSTPATGNTVSTNLTLLNLNPNTTYYIWVRSNCGSSTSSWVFGNNFSTVGASPSGCTSSQNGVLPSTTFTPGCFGNTETILTNAVTRQYSNVTLTANTRYTFTTNLLGSDYPTGDYITITNANASQIYVVGTTPLVWDSGNNSGIMRYYIHSNFACGFDSLNRTKSISCTPTPNCNPPSTLGSSSITSNSATISWAVSSPIPSSGYQYYISTSNTAPTAATTPSGFANGTSVVINGLNPTTLYYVWVRSNCGTSTSSWSTSINFSTTAAAPTGCTTATYGLYPDATFTPTCSGTAQIIVTDAYTSEYSNVTILPNTNYTFSSSVTTDFITISNASATSVYTSGLTPLIWNSGTNTGTIRYYFHSNSSCDGIDIERTKLITCSASQGCSSPTNATISNISNTSAQLTWVAVTPSPALGYDIFISTINSISPSTIPTLNVSGTIATLASLTPSTTYYTWIRSKCGASSTSNWVAIPSFTTLAMPAGCTNATNGLYPDTTFTPSCIGTNESITSIAFSSEYSNVIITANTNYTFSSSITTDFITISNATGTSIFASGISPLVWNSGTNSGTVRYYFHSDSSCSEDIFERSKFILCTNTQSCNPPFNLTVANVLSTSAVLNWNAVSPAPANGYDVYLSTTNSVTAATVPIGTVSATNAQLTNLTPGTTYYFWVRSNCGTSGVSSWVSGPSFTTALPTGTGCITASYGLYPDTTFTPACSGVAQTIVVDAYAGEYSNINIIANRQYTFSSSVATDFITIANADATVIYASGNTPLQWNSNANTGIIRYYFHTNALCGEQQTNRTKSITCSTVVQVCAVPSNLTVANVLSTSAVLNWNAASPAPANGYDVYVSTTNSVTAATVPTGTISGLAASLTSLQPSTIYFFWVRSNCGTSNVSSWVAGPSFTTALPTGSGCITASYGLYPDSTFTPACLGVAETIVVNAYAGEYSNINIIANRQYTFTSSVTTDFITISNANATVLYASGVSPIVWNSGSNTGVIRYYLHTNALCGEADVDRAKLITCTTILDDSNFETNFAKMYPNPTSTLVNIVGQDNFDSIFIVNNLGQLLREFTNVLNETQIDMSGYPTGIYFVKVVSGTKRQTFKLIKE